MSIDFDITRDLTYRVNRYSDFQLEFSLMKDDEAYVPTAFKAVFYVEDWNDCCSRYTASCIDGVCTNCSVHGTVIRVFFNAPGFNLGQLKCRFVDMADDPNFSDGTLDTCTPMTMPVEIVAGPGDTDTIILGYGESYFGDDHDLVLEGASSPSFGDDNSLEI